MSFRKIKPTKTNLIGMQKKLNFAFKGENFLEFKRELLIYQIKKVWPDYQDQRKVFLKSFRETLIRLDDTFKEMGKQRFKMISEISKIQYNPLVNINFVKSKGIVTPQIDFEFKKEKQLPAYSFDKTSHYLDELVNLTKTFVENLIKLAEKEAIIENFAFDYKRIHRRINGLKNIIIPGLKLDIKKIKEYLEEIDREGFVRLKKTKELIKKKQKVALRE